MGEVVLLGGWTKLPIPVDRVLDGAKQHELETVLVLGWDKNGKFYAAASEADSQASTYMAQRFIHKTHAGDYGDD